ncbi:MAG: cation:proton antiporter [Patescibacteria group bacterium]
MTLFVQISIVIVIAALMAIFVRTLRQPLIIGYILTGLIVGPYFFNFIQDTEIINVFSEIGIALLLFIVGLGLNPRLIKEIGGVALAAGTSQVVFTSLVGFFVCRGLGFLPLESAYLAVALSFSSTIIIVKLLSDKQALQKLYGKIALGFLLVQDIIAMLILIFISALAQGEDLSRLIGVITLQGIALALLSVFASLYLLPRLSNIFTASSEFLALFALAWGLGLASLFYKFGFSIEIGALIAGITLSVSPYAVEISAKMKPLRDFFLILFFILLGSKLALGDIQILIIPALLLSLFILIVNPLIMMLIMSALGYHKRTGFLTGLTVAQISEFSLILIMFGIKSGDLNDSLLSLVTLVGLITIAASTYLIIYAEKIYPYLAPVLTWLERKKTKIEAPEIKNYNAILFGYNRIGYDFTRAFNKLKQNFLVADFDPQVIKKLEAENIACVYGDADDGEFLDELALNKIKLAVSTIPDFATNLLLIKKIRRVNKPAIIMIISHNIGEAEKLYAAGASYVILPHFLGGSHASALIAKYGLNSKKYSREKTNHLKYLAARKMVGHEHPARPTT